MAPVQSTTNPSTSSTQVGDSNTGKSPLVQKYLTNCKSFYSCIYCRTHLADHDELVSRSFQGNHGRAYLFNSVINVYCGTAVHRALNTGSHAVADIFCTNCDTTLGWKYEKAYVEGQKYKEGKYIIELAHVVRENRHLELDKGELLLGRAIGQPRKSSYTSTANSPSPQTSSFTSSSSSSSSTSSERRTTIQNHCKSSPVGTRSHLPVRAGSLLYEEVADDDDEELMFPFYDDLCSSRSSYPSSFSFSQHNRMRRSLLMESTPYDWKHQAAADHEQEAQCSNQRENVSSSLDSSCLSPSTSSSSSSTGSSSGVSPSFHTSNHKQNFNSRAENNCVIITNSDTASQQQRQCDNNNYVDYSEDDEGETQFKFDTEKLVSWKISEQAGSVGKKENEQQCDRMTSEQAVNKLGTRGTNNNNLSETNGSQVGDNATVHPPSAGNSTDVKLARSSLESSMSMEDEEFYDCYTDQDAANVTPPSSKR